MRKNTLLVNMGSKNHYAGSKEIYLKIDDLRKSSNIEDRRGQSSSNSSFSSGSSGGNVLL